MMVVRKKSLLYGIYIFPLLPILLSNSTLYYYGLTALKIVFGMFGFIISIRTVGMMKQEKTLWFLFCLMFILPYMVYGRMSVSVLALNIYPIGYFFGLCSLCCKQYETVVSVLYFWAKFISIAYVMILISQILLGTYGNPILYNNDNAEQIYLTLVIYAVLLHHEYNNKHNIPVKDILMIVISFAGIVHSGSATGIMAAGVGVLVIFGYRIISLFKILISYLIIFVIIVILHATDIPVIQVFLRIFEKSTTFSNRYWRWMFSLQNINEHILLGDCEIEKQASLYAGYNVDYFNPHNALLYLLTFGGVLCVVFLGIIFWRMRNCKYRSYLVAAAMIAVTGLMESNVAPKSTFFLIVTVMTLYCEYRRKEGLRNQ